MSLLTSAATSRVGAWKQVAAKSNLATRPLLDQIQFMRTTSKLYKLAEAKARLGQLCDQTIKGTRTRIVRGGELFELVHVARTEVMPATAAELSSIYNDQTEIRLTNRFGQESL